MREQGVRAVQMRFGRLISDQGVIPDLYRIDKKGNAFWSRIGSGEQWMPWIHAVDGINMIIHAIEQEEISGPLNAVAPEAIQQQQFAKELARVLPSSTFKIPMYETVANWMLPKRANLILEGRKVIPRVAEETQFDFKYRTIASAMDSLEGFLIPIDWKSPANHYVDGTQKDGVPRN